MYFWINVSISVLICLSYALSRSFYTCNLFICLLSNICSLVIGYGFVYRIGLGLAAVFDYFLAPFFCLRPFCFSFFFLIFINFTISCWPLLTWWWYPRSALKSLSKSSFDFEKQLSRLLSCQDYPPSVNGICFMNLFFVIMLLSLFLAS